jgi:hypothetical protein
MCDTDGNLEGSAGTLAGPSRSTGECKLVIGGTVGELMAWSVGQ